LNVNCSVGVNILILVSSYLKRAILIMTANQSTKHQCNFDVAIDVPITDFILTPLSCAHIVNEVMKNLLYQRSQIPYPYTWLKNIVSKKRESFDESKNRNFTLNRHFQIVSSAYDAAENIMSNISKHFSHLGSNLKEVIFVLGVSPVCPKEIFTVKVSSLANGHIERNHVADNSKKQPRILRDIFLSEIWMGLLESSLTCCNMYIFLKVTGPQNDLTAMHKDTIFVPSKPLLFPSKTKHTVINLNYSNPSMCSCCDNLEVFQDFCDIESSIQPFDVKVDQTDEGSREIWLQSKILFQGFKDCFINKVSACELW
jgi:hypothetical protein